MKTTNLTLNALRLLTLAGLISIIVNHTSAMALDAEMTPLRQARLAIQEEQWAQAASILEPLTKAEPDNRPALFQLANVYENTNRLTAAKNIYIALANIPDAEKSNYVAIALRGDVQYMALLSDLAQERVVALNALTAVAPTPAPLPAATAPVIVAAAPVVVAVPPPAIAASVSNPSPPAQAAESLAIAQMRQWIKAWRTKDLPAYFASYAPGYKGDMPSADAWQKARTQRIKTKEKIDINAYDIQEKSLGTDEVQLKFTQAYVSNTFTDMTQKTLVMLNKQGRWLITKETTK